MDTALLGLRVVLSLACVLGLIWFAARKLQGTAGARKQRSVPMAVLGRQSLGKGSGIALVEVAGRVLLLGVGEQGVRVLTEVDVPAVTTDPSRGDRTSQVREEIDLATLPLEAEVGADFDVDLDAELHALTGDPHQPPADPQRSIAEQTVHAGARTRRSAHAGAAPSGALAGSILSPGTWRRAVDVLQRGTSR